MYRALTLDEANYLGHRILRWNRDHHVHMIDHKMSLFDPTLLLLRQAAEYLSKMFS